jgi:hypothetical protein
MAVGGLHTNPVTVAITVTTREEAERLGSALSQQQSGGLIFGRQSQGGHAEDDGSVRGSVNEPYDEEAASHSPSTSRERPGAASAGSSSTGPVKMSRAPSISTASPRNTTEREPLNRSNSKSPQRSYEMSTLNRSASQNESASAASTMKSDEGRRSLITGEVSSAKKYSRAESSSPTSELFSKSSTLRK